MKHSIIILLFVMANNFALVGQSTFESYYFKVNSYPEDQTTNWHPNGTELQGVTHDDANWFFTVTDKDKSNGHLWKIPVSTPLHNNIGANQSISMSDVDALSSSHYWHFGDPDHYTYEGTTYILVPVTGNGTPIIACFRADNLVFKNYAFLDATKQGDVGWCAIDPVGNLYTSRDDTDVFYQYEVDWKQLTQTGNHSALNWVKSVPLRGLNGAPLFLKNMQGGEFSPSGELLYISSGSGECNGYGHGVFPTDGIHVFQIEAGIWREIKKSDNRKRDEIGYFEYSFDNGCTCAGTGSQHPEGLTVWDLDNGAAPNISGQLHVTINFYNVAFCDDAFSLHHFTNKIIVDKNSTQSPNLSIPLIGNKIRPFKTLSDALNYYPIWDGAHIILRAGEYPSAPVNINKRMLITSEGGAAIIK